MLTFDKADALPLAVNGTWVSCIVGTNMRPPQLASLALSMVLGWLGSGCSHYTSAIDPDDKVDPKSAYLYGRFSIESKDRFLAMDSYESMGFRFKCESGASYTIRFSKEAPIQVIRIKPSRCEFVEVVCSDADGQVLRRISVAPGTLRNGRFLSGRGYYLGDFYAKATVRARVEPFVTHFRHRWGLRDVQNNYKVTTEIMREEFPRLFRLPTEDRMLGE